MPTPWGMLAGLSEKFLIEKLLRSPTFHKGVGYVHKRVHQIRTGEKAPERGGTSIEDTRGAESLFKHFTDEVKNQLKDLGGGKRK